MVVVVVVVIVVDVVVVVGKRLGQQESEIVIKTQNIIKNFRFIFAIDCLNGIQLK